MRYVVRYATIRPELKGKWGGKAWTQADTLEISHFRPESQHRPRTLARLLWDEGALHGIFRVQDRYVRCVHTGYMAPTHLDSCVETFLQPKANKGYLNFEFNCGGSMLCFHIVDATRVPGGFRDFTHLPEDDGRQVSVYHSMPARVEPEIAEPTEWYLEFAIPFSVLEKRVGPLGRVGGQEWPVKSAN